MNLNELRLEIINENNVINDDSLEIISMYMNNENLSKYAQKIKKKYKFDKIDYLKVLNTSSNREDKVLVISNKKLNNIHIALNEKTNELDLVITVDNTSIFMTDLMKKSSFLKNKKIQLEKFLEIYDSFS